MIRHTLALLAFLVVPSLCFSSRGELRGADRPAYLPAPVVESPRASSPALIAPHEFASIIVAASGAVGIPAWILARVIEAESDWIPSAVRVNVDGSRDLGIAQLSERYLSDFAWFDNGGQAFNPFNASEAIPIAAHYLARLHTATGDWASAVAAYNCGLSRVLSGAIPERTRAYVETVLREAKR